MLLRLFRRPDYRSEVTQFIDGLKAAQPDLEQRQSAGRQLLWDKQLNREAWAGFKAARVAQKPYVYQTEFEQH